MNEPPYRSRHFDESPLKPQGYYEHLHSLRSTKSDRWDLTKVLGRGRAFCASSAWCFPNREAVPCDIVFDVVEHQGFGAFSWFDGSSHWIVMHTGVFHRLDGWFERLFSSSGYIEALGIQSQTPEWRASKRESAVNMALEFLFRHELMHVLLGHTGFVAAGGVLHAVSDAPTEVKTVPADSVIIEHAADFFASTSIAAMCAERRFVMLAPDELPAQSDKVSLPYLAFLGASAMLGLWASAGLEDRRRYPTLRTRLATVVQGFLTNPNLNADAENLERVVTLVIRDLQHGFRSISDIDGARTYY